MTRKINLEKVQASLDVVCPKCGKAISPAEVSEALILSGSSVGRAGSGLRPCGGKWTHRPF
jgi:hypothetical protein